jgi:adenylylsulfate kinase-like enzyme
MAGTLACWLQVKLHRRRFIKSALVDGDGIRVSHSKKCAFRDLQKTFFAENLQNHA